MEIKRLCEIVNKMRVRGQPNYQYCRSIVGELGIDPASVDSEDVAGIRRNVAKAVTKKVRLEICRIAMEHKLIEIGKPLSVIGTKKLLLRVNESGLLIIPRDTSSIGNQTTYCYPINMLMMAALNKL
jgi:hypothetical protein